MKSAQLSRFTRSTQRQENAPCRNCATIYSGNYCPECGQESYTGAPTAVDFIYEFLTRNVFERGKMPRTLWHLLRYPGGLTVDFLEGRRARFIRPVRLYFGLSVLYFLLLSLSTSTEKISSELIKASSQTIPQATAAAEKAALNKPLVPDPKKNREEILAKISEATDVPDFNIQFFGNRFSQDPTENVKKRIKDFVKLPQEEQLHQGIQALFNQAPKAMFFLVPVFALLLKLLFMLRRISYGAHLLFAFHCHAFIFLCLIFLLLPLPGIISVPVQWLMWGYPLLAIRTTYLCSWPSAIWRWLTLSILYPTVIATTLGLATLSAVFML
ncbi:DUF3667 domain-containing protein [Undibacterium sp. Ren11W]|uniref:DUF3667 domain-containing protein n=1 Tax=Undibacterium sp. Ren11W TaxID=3413045 RepID=UPI003BEF8904